MKLSISPETLRGFEDWTAADFAEDLRERGYSRREVSYLARKCIEQIAKDRRDRRPARVAS